MIGSPSMTKSGEFGAALIALAVTAATWQMLSRAATYLLAENGWPSIAINVRPWDGLALRNHLFVAMGSGKARRKSIAADIDIIERLAKTALQSRPIDPTMIRRLAQSAEAKGDAALADRLMDVAGKQTIRDGAVDAYLLKHQAARADYTRALERADALLRVMPALTAATLSAIDTIAADRAAREALVALLRSGPPWRGAFLADIASKLVEPAEFLDVITDLKEGPHPLTDEELRAYLEPLIARDLVDQAYGIWLQSLSSKRLGALRYLDNGDFKYPATNLPFDWTVTPIDGATIAIDDTPDRLGRGLHVSFDGKRVPFRNVTRMLKLPIGRYRLSGSYWSMALDNPRGMTWRLYCAQRLNPLPIAQTDRVSGTSNGWKTFETSFEIPPEHCGAQWLRLELAARVKAEESVAGEIWYDHIDVGKTDDDHAAPVASRIRMPDQPGTAFERAVRTPQP